MTMILSFKVNCDEAIAARSGTWFSRAVALIAVCVLFSSQSFASNLTYSYDSLNRLKNVDYGNGSIITYTYDAAGNRLSYSGVVTNDAVAPSITITNPTSGSTFTTSTATINLDGTATDNFSISLVTWDNDQGDIGVASGTTSWSINGIRLQTGTNLVFVTAYDPAGNKSTAGLTIISTSGATPPHAGFTGSPTNGAATLLVNFTDSSSGTVTSRAWTFGDGGTSTLTSPSHPYTNAGSCSVICTYLAMFWASSMMVCVCNAGSYTTYCARLDAAHSKAAAITMSIRFMAYSSIRRSLVVGFRIAPSMVCSGTGIS